jgi:hypothetical protein
VPTEAVKTEEIGLLLVHGMGEQKEQEHLLGAAKELASFVAATPGVIRVSVVDDRKGSRSVIVDSIRRRDGVSNRTRLHLQEVWWADLGISGGLWEQAKFWLWGLGQWAARTIRKGDRTRNTEKLMTMPRFRYQQEPGDPPGALRELPSRLLLIGAALLAILTFFTWSAAKQVVSLLSRRLPEPSLIFMFLGDVKIYERPGGPGKGTLLDPDQPVRTTIRRRMVSAMTAMAARTDLDRWYVFAHSLGTIPAFNALQETELALPNYLSEAEWEALPPQFKTRTPFEPPGPAPSTDRMMPRRPAWLDEKDGISRPRLFERFAGLVTYGSPLDKFAALWPRVVPLNRQAEVFPATSEWVNLHDPTDPVAASLDAFAPPKNSAGAEPGRIALVPQNFASRASPVFGLSHIRYFRPRAPSPKSMPAALAEALLSGPGARLSTAASRAAVPAGEAWLRMILALLQVLLLLAALTAAAAGLLLAVGKALPDRAVAYVKQLIAKVSPDLLEVLQAGGKDAWIASGFIVLIAALTAILLAGLARFATEGSGRHG